MFTNSVALFFCPLSIKYKLMFINIGQLLALLYVIKIFIYIK